MRMTVYVNDMTFKTAVINDVSAQKAKDSLYRDIHSINKFSFEAQDGSFVVLGETALKDAVFVFGEN